MTTKRFPFHASTLCAGGTLLVLGGFLALNLAGCGGGGGGIGTPTSIPGTTPTAVPASVQFLLQLIDGTAATGGTVRLTSIAGVTYNGTANNRGIASVGRIAPGVYTLVFGVRQANGTTVTTTRSITIASPTSSGVQTYLLRQGDTGNSNPFTISGRIYLNPAGVDDPDGNSATPNCAQVTVPITDALIISVRDLNSTNGQPIIASITRPAQPTATGTQRGFYSISVPYQPRSFRVEVRNANDAPFAGVSAATTFPTTITTVENINVCTNASNTAPVPGATELPSPTPILTATAVGTPIATPTNTPIDIPTATPRPTNTPIPTATPVPTNTPLPGQIPTNTPTGQPAPTNTPTGGTP